MTIYNYEIESLIDNVKNEHHYLSETKKEVLNSVKGNYPQLCTYESEWIYFDETGYIPGKPVEIEYQTVEGTNGIVKNAIPHNYKSAILKGWTLVNIATKHQGGSNGGGEVIMKATLLKANTKYYIKVIDDEFNLKRASFRTKDWKDRWYSATNGVAILTTPSQDEFNNYKYLVFNVIKNDETIEIDSAIRDRLKWIICEYQEGMENWDIPYFEGMQSVKMPVLTTSNEDGTKTNILTVNEDVELRGVVDVQDTLDLMTGELTERIGEVVLDGSENWKGATVGSSGTFMRFYINVHDAYLQEEGSDILCDRFTSIPHGYWDTDIEGIHAKHTAIHINIPTSKLESNDASGFKKWLSSNPVTVYYTLATESIKTVDLTPISFPFEGVNHFTTSSDTIPPSMNLQVPVVSTGEQTLQEINN